MAQVVLNGKSLVACRSAPEGDPDYPFPQAFGIKRQAFFQHVLQLVACRSVYACLGTLYGFDARDLVRLAGALTARARQHG